MKKISVACIAVENGKVLIAKRIQKGQMGGRWEFPGGKNEDGESEEETCIREMNEEFGIKVECGKLITEGSFFHNDSEITLRAHFIKVPRTDSYTLTEHTEYKWVNPEEIKNLNFVDSDLLIYPKVLEYIKNSGEAE
ncbi:MAG: NUDIX domain-containing protein [Treponema sp.]|nr:NUDIX domain-containing protein [Treponema sp.]